MRVIYNDDDYKQWIADEAAGFRITYIELAYIALVIGSFLYEKDLLLNTFLIIGVIAIVIGIIALMIACYKNTKLIKYFVYGACLIVFIFGGMQARLTALFFMLFTHVVYYKN